MLCIYRRMNRAALLIKCFPAINIAALATNRQGRCFLRGCPTLVCAGIVYMSLMRQKLDRAVLIGIQQILTG